MSETENRWSYPSGYLWHLIKQDHFFFFEEKENDFIAHPTSYMTGMLEGSEGMNIRNLKCSGKRCPLQVNPQNVTFSWNLTAEDNGQVQTGYEIWVGQGETALWESGRRSGSQCLYIPYEGPRLNWKERYDWKVRVWDKDNRSCGWSNTTWFETDLGEENWKALWIGFDKVVGAPFDREKPFYCADDFQSHKNEYYLPPVPFLRKEFTVTGRKAVRSARLYVSALGLIEAEINGRKVTGDAFIPGFSDYRKTVYTRAYPAEEYIETGGNGIGIKLADGWYAGYMGLNNREWYGSKPRVSAELHIRYEDGSSDIIRTDPSWKASYGPVREADIFQGETYDANLEQAGWSSAGFADGDWEQVDTGAVGNPQKVPHPGPGVAEHSHIIPEIIRIENNKMLLEFPHYVCGVCACTVAGTKGSRFTLRHAELLDEHGKLHLEGNRSARCEDTYLLKGTEKEHFRPEFTYHGFRYAEITVEGTVDFLSIEGIQMGSALPDPTRFHCSAPMANRVFEMVRNTEKANMFEIPTDCTARDERLGWGMEGNHFMYAMSYLNNQRDAIQKWCRDIFDGQRADGALEAIAPAVVMKDIEPFIGDLQSNHGLYMVHALYKIYGDLDAVRYYLEPLKRYFKFLEKNSDRFLRYATSCDWLGILEETDHSDTNHGYGECSSLMLGTAHYAVAADMMAELCEAVEDEAADSYRLLNKNIVKAYRKNFIERSGMLRRGKQGDYLMALYADMIPREALPRVLAYFRKQLLKSGYIRWFGGTPTTPYFLKTLKKYGMNDLANQFLTASTYPSIGFMHKMGSDTIWERWDAIFEDGTIHPQVMNAISHEGYAAIGDYFISGLAGIEALEPGFKKILFEPGVSREITAASARYQSIYGEIATSWEWKHGKFSMKCQIPVNTQAMIKLPKGSVNPGFIYGIPDSILKDGESILISLSSGVYELEAELWNLQDYYTQQCINNRELFIN